MKLDISPAATPRSSGADGAAPSRGAGRGAGVALMLGSGLSNQTGASVAALVRGLQDVSRRSHLFGSDVRSYWLLALASVES
ncbi:hypothetical protein ACFXMQ_20675, partial [Streptomyces anulatus]